MADLENPITTQEDLDAIISERLKRKDEQMAKKYADYDDLRKSSEESAATIADLQKQLDDFGVKSGEYEKQIAELTAKTKGYETNSAKMRIALESGLPYELADRLTGDDEESLRKDAQKLRGIIGGTKPKAPSKSNDIPADGKAAAYKELLSSLKGE